MCGGRTFRPTRSDTFWGVLTRSEADRLGLDRLGLGAGRVPRDAGRAPGVPGAVLPCCAAVLAAVPAWSRRGVGGVSAGAREQARSQTNSTRLRPRSLSSPINAVRD